MKKWKVFMAVAMAVVTVVLMTSIVMAGPASTSLVQTSDVFESPILTDTVPFTHPVGMMIARYFNIPYTQVMALHDEGLGFGEIARAYLTAAASGGALTPEQVLAMRQDGMGWGQFKKEYGIHPGGNGLGSIMGNKPHLESTSPLPEVKLGSNGSGGCPGNSCNAPGQQKAPKEKSDKPEKPAKVPKK
jgi:hypothetical protein